MHKQVAELKHRIAIGLFEPQVPLNARRIPENWVPQRFNGITYYLVPLDSTPPSAAKPLETPVQPTSGN